MIQLNLEGMLKSKGIKKPYTYLRSIGFTATKARNIPAGRYNSIAYTDLSRLCHALNCTPNDLFNWNESPEFPIGKTHVLHTIKKEMQDKNLADTIQTAPVHIARELNQWLEERLKQEENQ
jgi:DNA-binding Xre family transcriptional regulator